MKTLPTLKFNTFSDKQKLFIDQWLDSWNIIKELKNDNIDDEYIPDGSITNEQISNLKSLVNPFDTNLKAGEIRLLSPAVVPNTQRPYYAALLEETENNNFLLVPFSSFSVPADSQELLLTNRQNFQLAVLQLWNTLYIPCPLLQKSWFVDNMTEKEIYDAISVYKGSTRPQEIMNRTGIQIFNKMDPRNEYHKLESDLLNPLKNRIKMYNAFISNIPKQFSVLKDTTENLNFSLAADSNEPRESKCIFIKKPTQDIFVENIIASAEKNAMILSLHEGDHFTPLNPNTKFTNEIQWQIPETSEFSNGTILFGIDTKTKNIIGTGSVEYINDEKFAAVKIHYPALKRTIPTVNDIMLIAVDI